MRALNYHTIFFSNKRYLHIYRTPFAYKTHFLYSLTTRFFEDYSADEKYESEKANFYNTAQKPVYYKTV